MNVCVELHGSSSGVALWGGVGLSQPLYSHLSPFGCESQPCLKLCPLWFSNASKRTRSPRGYVWFKPPGTGPGKGGSSGHPLPGCWTTLGNVQKISPGSQPSTGCAQSPSILCCINGTSKGSVSFLPHPTYLSEAQALWSSLCDTSGAGGGSQAETGGLGTPSDYSPMASRSCCPLLSL